MNIGKVFHGNVVQKINNMRVYSFNNMNDIHNNIQSKSDIHDKLDKRTFNSDLLDLMNLLMVFSRNIKSAEYKQSIDKIMNILDVIYSESYLHTYSFLMNFSDPLYKFLDIDHNKYIIENMNKYNDKLVLELSNIEDEIKFFNDKSPKLVHFIAPSQNINCALLNLIRTVSRRVERSCNIHINDKKKYYECDFRFNDPNKSIMLDIPPYTVEKLIKYAEYEHLIDATILKILNRLSSYVFALMRYIEYNDNKKKEIYFKDWSDSFITKLPSQENSSLVDIGKTVIYTKQGDAGSTSSLTGAKVLKCSDNIKLAGDLDELQAIFGLLIAANLDNPDIGFLSWINYKIYDYQGMLARQNFSVDKQIEIRENELFAEYQDILKNINLIVPYEPCYLSILLKDIYNTSINIRNSIDKTQQYVVDNFIGNILKISN